VVVGAGGEKVELTFSGVTDVIETERTYDSILVSRVFRLTAFPEIGYAFDRWTVELPNETDDYILIPNGKYEDNPVFVSMSGEAVITAVFEATELPVDPLDVDNDGDGFTENEGDCNDTNATISPAGIEICGDGIDQDCSGFDMECPVECPECNCPECPECNCPGCPECPECVCPECPECTCPECPEDDCDCGCFIGALK